MKLPHSPPDFHKLLSKVVKEGVEKMGKVLSGPPDDGRYLHWDEIIRRPPPEGWNHEEWWLQLKFRRQGLAKQIPLEGKKRDPFWFCMVDPIPEQLHKIDQGAGGLIEIPEQITNPETRNRYYVSSLIEEAITSSQLEGASVTRKIAKEMIRTGRDPRDRGERMIYNNFLTMERIGELKKQPLTPDVVFEIQRLVTDRALDDPAAAGRFRRPDEDVVVAESMGDQIYHRPPPADTLKDRMDLMCRFANGEVPEGFVHPVIRSIILHFWLAYDHPFVDGNGRTARALFYWSMLRSGFWLFEYISISQIIVKAPIKYERAFLYTETDGNDLTYFVLYHIEVLRRAISSLHDYLKRKSAETRRAEQLTRNLADLNHRQVALLSHALRHPGYEYTIESHRTSHRVVYQTARTDLLDLAQKGLLQVEKIGKSSRFTPAKDLEARIIQGQP